MTRLLILFTLVLQLAFSTSPSLAFAQARASADDEARALFEAGRVAFSRGRYERALENFREAYALSARAELLYNIGTALDRLRRDAEAIEAFEEFLERRPDSDYAPEVRERVRILRQSQGEASADAPPDLSPAAVAQTSDVDPAVASEEPVGDEPQRASIARSWWFWTIVGAVVVGAGVGVGVGASRAGGPPGPLPFDDHTLRVEL